MDATFYHDTHKYGYRTAINNAIKKNIITQGDKELITEYLTDKQVQDHISDSRVDKITSILIGFRKFLLVEYSSADIAEVYEAIKDLKNGNSKKGKPFKQNTIHTYVVILKPFFTWMIQNGKTNLPIKKIRAIKPPAKETNTTNPDEIHTVEEIEKVIDACQNPRDKALVSVLYESGMRIGELAGLTWRQVVFDDRGVKCYINDMKEKQRRYTRLTMSHEYLARWHKYCSDRSPDARVFVNLQDKSPLKYITIRRLLDRLQVASGIEKPLRPHLFRKDRITHMIAQNYQESMIKKTMWGNLHTDMFETYVCLAESDIDNEFLTKAGLERIKDHDRELKPIPCVICGYVNEPKADYCSRCGTTLSEKAAVSLQRMRDSVLMNQALLNKILSEYKDLEEAGSKDRAESETGRALSGKTLPDQIS